MGASTTVPPSWLGSGAAQLVSITDPAYAASTTAADNGPAINAAINAVAVAGGILWVPPGVFQFTTPLVVPAGVSLRGEAMPNGGSQPGSTLLFTGGAGIARAIDARSANGVTFDGVNIGYNNAAFTGILIDHSHGGAATDTYGASERNCLIFGVESTAQTAVLVGLDKVISHTIDRVNFLGGGVQVQGTAPPGSSYSNIVNLTNTHHTHPGITAIRNPNDAWKFDSCIFEPRPDGVLKALTFSAFTAAYLPGGVTLINCWAGDGTAGNATTFDVIGSGWTWIGGVYSVPAFSGSVLIQLQSTIDGFTMLGTVFTGGTASGSPSRVISSGSTVHTNVFIAGYSVAGQGLAGTFFGGTIPTGAIIQWVSGPTLNPAGVTLTPVSGTIYQNTTGGPLYLDIPVTYNPLVGSAATCALALGTSSTPATVSTISVPANDVVGRILPARLMVPHNWYYSLTVVNATLGTGYAVRNP